MTELMAVPKKQLEKWMPLISSEKHRKEMQKLIDSPPLKIEQWADGLCSYLVYSIPTKEE